MIRNALVPTLLALAAASPAVVVDFENLAGGVRSPFGDSIRYASPLTTQGYVFSAGSAGFDAWTPGFFYTGYTGSTALMPPEGRGPADSPRSGVTMTRADGGAFDVRSVDIAGGELDAVSVTISGEKAGGGGVSQTFADDGALRTAVLSGFTGLKSLRIEDFQAGNFQFDNVNVVASPVPEPSTLAAMGFGALTLLRRRAARR